MKYWLCIDGDGTQGIGFGTIIKNKEMPDSNWGSFKWVEISEEEYKRIVNTEITSENYSKYLIVNHE